jgi:hypothetical protein
MYLLHSDGLLTGFSLRSFLLLSSVPSEYTQSFSTTLSFAPSREFFGSKLYSNHLFGPAAPTSYSRKDFGPSNCSFRASSTFETFEVGLRSLESSSRASSAFETFEVGLRSLESSSRASSAFETFEMGLRSLKSSSRANSASRIFEEGLRSLELLLSGQQGLQDIWGRTSAPRVTSFGPAAPSRYSRQGFGPSDYLFWASSAFEIFEARLRSFESPFWLSGDFKEFELEL